MARPRNQYPIATERTVHGTDVPDLPAERAFALAAAGMDVVAHTGPDSTVLVLTGELDYATRPALERAVDRALAAGPARLVVDLSDLEFLAVAGAHLFEQTARRCRERGGELELRDPRRSVRRLLGLFGIADLIEKNPRA